MTLKNQSQDPWDREDRPDLFYDRLYSSQVWKIKIFYALAYDPFYLTGSLEQKTNVFISRLWELRISLSPDKVCPGCTSPKAASPETFQKRAVRSLFRPLFFNLRKDFIQAR